MATDSVEHTSNSSRKSWVELYEEECSPNIGQEEKKTKSKIQLEERFSLKVSSCSILKAVKEESCQDENKPVEICEEEKVDEIKIEIKTETEESPWRGSYASILKSKDSNSASKGSDSKVKQTVKQENVDNEDSKPVKSAKREIQRDFLHEDLSLSSHLDIFHMESPMKVDEQMASPSKPSRASKRLYTPTKMPPCEDSLLPDDVLMPSPKKVTRLSSRRKREPGESPLVVKRSKRSSTHTTPKCVVSVTASPIECETDEQVLMRRQKQIDYGKNTIGYERYCQIIPKEKRHKKHPQTPPKHNKYSRRAWDGLIKQWRQRLHFWDPPSEGGGNIEDLDMSSMSEASSDTASQASSLPATPHDKPRRSSRIGRSSASECSSLADDEVSTSPSK